MAKFPISPELITQGIRGRIDATLTAQGHNLDWLAGEVGVSTHRLLADFSTGPSFGLLWDTAEVLGVPLEFLATGAKS
jgi:hypothetical protein